MLILKDVGEVKLEVPISVKALAERMKYNGVIAAVLDGKLIDVRDEVISGQMEFVTLDHPMAPQVYRHTMSHIMAQAVMRIFGENRVLLGIGPVIENGFYYDFEIVDGRIVEEDLPRIEEEMRKIIEEDLTIERFTMKRDEAIQFMKNKGQKYKVELLNEMQEEIVTFYKQGEFVDLCRGPHLPSTGMVKHFKLLSLSGAYWRGDERNPMLQRIYGTAFTTEEELNRYIEMIEEAKRRDHRKLGPALGIFFIDHENAPGMPIFTPAGTIILRELMNFSRELHLASGYQEVMTPLVMSEKLWKMSGHWDHYKENMYFTSKEDQNFAIKPMNCPGHILIYKSRPVSYRDLPIRYFEFGKVHRYERSGVLHGLLRVRSFTQDDAHIFCRIDQIEKEIVGIIRLIERIYAQFGFEYSVELSTMPENHMGDVETWNMATESLKNALDSIKLPYTIKEGEGAFYGPKIDFHVKDSIGRTWQCATVQLDFLMPQRFDLYYVDSDGSQVRPVMIHTAKYGSLERFLGILIEHFAGAFPTWLTPTQVVVLPISDRHTHYAEKIVEKFSNSGVRIKLDARHETLSYRVREAQTMKIPYMFIVGDREMNENKVSVRTRKGTDLGPRDVDQVLSIIVEEIKTRSLKNLLEG
ncbi:threonine--tRNA ligase [Thermotoga sp. Ku-13t]|uniref:threonine--tRNA ligase n=1 Tax=Thermotoga sp. Ku-13t TaxID=1755813 RepID=UPI0013EACF73|nr:threonine--tRNA ligase [Thermotoga sp. Ku-13t]